MKQFSDSTWIVNSVLSYKKQSPRYSFTGLFRHLRKMPSLEAFRDYTLMHFIVSLCTKKPYNFDLGLRRLFKLSNDVSLLPEREKKQLMTNLSQ